LRGILDKTPKRSKGFKNALKHGAKKISKKVAKIPPGELQAAQALVKHSYETENIRIESADRAARRCLGRKLQVPSAFVRLRRDKRPNLQ
jgi:hypothetical protein